MQAIVGEEDELVSMGEEIPMLHEHEHGLHRQIQFEHIGLDEVTLGEQQFPLLTDSMFPSGRLIPLVDTTSMRSAAHVTLNELGKRLLVASRTGNTEEVKELMAKGAPFTCDWLGTSALHLAAQNDNIETADILLRAGISRDARTKVDKTPLHLAATEGNTILVQMLLGNGSDVNACDMLRMTPLHWAVDRQHVDVIKLLLEHGANPNIISKFDKTVFSIAMDNNRPDLIKYIQTVKPVQNPYEIEESNREIEEATLAATHSLTNEMAQVPAVSQQEEVETSATDTSKFFVNEDYLATKELMLQETCAESMLPSTSSANMSNVEDDLVPSSHTMQYFQAHGITMLPLEESTLAESAIESGGTVVLTEAGKLAMNQTHIIEHAKKMALNRESKCSPSMRKLVALRKQSLGVNNVQKSPNILKRLEKEAIGEAIAYNEAKTVVALAEDLIDESQHIENTMFNNKRLEDAYLKLAEAERMARDAQKMTKEARLQSKQLKEKLIKSQRENEQFRQLIQVLKRKVNQ